MSITFYYKVTCSNIKRNKTFTNNKIEALNYARALAVKDNSVKVKEIERISGRNFSEKIIFDSSED
jgi:hypothetical protein